MNEEKSKIKVLWIWLVYLSWIGITAGFRYFLRLFNYQVINIWIWAAVRMTLLLAVTYLFIKFHEKKNFFEGKNSTNKYVPDG